MKVFLAFDGRMALHRPLQDNESNDHGFDSDSSSSQSDNMPEQKDVTTCNEEEGDHFEIPTRIVAIYHRLLNLEGWDGYRRFLEVECKPADRATIELVHSSAHYDFMASTTRMTDDELRHLSVPNDLYFCRETFLAARLAVGGVVECINAVTSTSIQRTYQSNRAIAIVRPPGHHACRDEAMGFCYFNNVAIGAKHAVATGRAKRVFILDWDIHHGNGIQDMTVDDPNIFYLSIHRASFSKRQSKWFYPGTGRPSEVGVGDGEGTNLNIVFGEGGMGDEEYSAAFLHLVLPVLKAFKPDLCLISCGLDAVQGDLLGDCGLSTEMYYTMTRSLVEASPGCPIVSVLEGGYNVEKSAECMEKVALALLDEPLDFEKRKNYVAWTTKSIMPQRPHIKSNQETSRMIKMSDFWHDNEDPISEEATKANRCAVKCIKRSVKALKRKGGLCLCGTHFLCPHHASLPIKKRKFLIGESSNDECLSSDSDLPNEVGRLEEEEGMSDSSSDVEIDRRLKSYFCSEIAENKTATHEDSRIL